MTDTAENRLKAIERISSTDLGMDAEWYSANPDKTKKLSKKDLVEFVIHFGKMINQCYIVSHGFNSTCCKGKGYKIVEDLLK